MFPRLCKECAYFQPNPVLAGFMDATQANGFGLCGRSALVHNPVDGTERHRFCATERENPSDTACGPAGRYWQMGDVETDAQPDPLNNPGA